MKLAGRYAIITGASQGLGRTIATRFVEEGASVMLCARGDTDLQLARSQLAVDLPAGQKVLALSTDVADPAQVDRLVATALDAFPHLDVLVNNAGVYGPLGPLEEVDWDAWVRAIQINLMGTVYPCRAVLGHFKRRGYGKILCLSGGGATNPLPRVTAYAASKAAIVRFAESLALEVRDVGIDVNSVAPGALATRLTDELVAAGAGRVGRELFERILKVQESGGTPLEIPADLCIYLASAASDGITGRLLSAPWDPWTELQQYRDDLDGSDIYTLRRIVPRDRGKGWGGK